MDIDCTLAFIYIFRAVINDNVLDFAKLTAVFMAHENALISKSPRDTYNVK